MVGYYCFIVILLAGTGTNFSFLCRDEVAVLKDLTGVNTVISFGVKYHNRITANLDIGDYEMVLWDHILPGKFNEDFWADLGEGKGKLHLKLEFVPK